jgi:BlaI family transcriptional regulator, penicillinase repressor
MFTRSWRSILGVLRTPADKDPLAAALGRLERLVMEVVWQHESVSVKDVQTKIPRRMAYTTVMTTMDRLFKKGMLHREREGRAFRYRAVHTRQDVERAVAGGLLRALLEAGGAARPMLSNLVDAISEKDHALLEELEELVREKRRSADLKGGSARRRVSPE